MRTEAPVQSGVFPLMDQPHIVYAQNVARLARRAPIQRPVFDGRAYLLDNLPLHPPVRRTDLHGHVYMLRVKHPGLRNRLPETGSRTLPAANSVVLLDKIVL